MQKVAKVTTKHFVVFGLSQDSQRLRIEVITEATQ